MSNLSITGKFIAAGKTESVGQNGFKIRRFWIDVPNNQSDTRNTPEFQLTGEKCSLVENFKPGDELELFFNVNGKKWEKESTDENGMPVKKSGVNTNLNVWKIQKITRQAASVVSTESEVVASNGEAVNDLPF
jgi:hypothetical protein